jgi:hypothetical protein
VDLDAPESIELAPEFLPETDRRHGRRSKRESHRWYISADGTAKTVQFKDGESLVELRGTGVQTVVPPSVHPSGERLVWHAKGDPATVEYADLKAAVSRLAAAALLARHWPRPGSRNDAALALAGTLLRGGMDAGEAVHFVEAVARVAGDGEVDSRVCAARSTVERLEQEEEVTGLPTLKELVGADTVKRLVKWLGLRQGRGSARGAAHDSPDLEEARGRLRTLTTASEEPPAQRIRGALEGPETVTALAALAMEASREFEAGMMLLREGGAKVKDIETLRRAVRSEVERLRRERAEDGEGLETYQETPRGLVWMRPTEDGSIPVPLTNFLAKIVTDIVLDDGVETTRTFEIRAKLKKRAKRFRVPAAKFAMLNWTADHLGARAIVYPGFGIRDHARTAIQVVSGKVPRKHLYTHTGWRRIRGDGYYLHAGGAIGPDGPVSSIGVSLSGALSHFLLPEPPTGQDVRRAVRASLGLLDLVPDIVSVPVLAAVYRAPLRAADFSIHLAGATGTGKTALAAVAQQHFGAKMDDRNLPGAWMSTANSLEGLTFAAKDALSVVDDFAPSGSKYDVQRAHREADRLLRSQGNQSGRSRMRSDTSIREGKPPRGLTLSTGEDIPRGMSLRARLFTLELSEGIGSR